ncbi:MAG: L-lactate dehydrogenase [Peptoniphilaceae bacterium]|nr:L-lactate dehydrogenase [Peptoniphilaceae bacterium]MDD7383437.1 L-lactate dehydrogenase [Peptoniphilaceae bacterium]MDY3738499.1 L-lactate dehydrogenase [Peptoniphilaceae bacterium]
MKDNKIIIVGDGAVGSSFAYTLVTKGIGREIGIIDLNEKKSFGDAMDLSDALSYSKPKEIYKATYSDCKDAKLVVITAGAAQKVGETRLDLVKKNIRIFKSMINNIVDSGFNGIFLVASNPVDILTYATWKFSNFPAHKVLGTGTSLDSARFRLEISKLLNIDTRNVHAYIMGEHGDSEFPVWSHANVGGLQLYEWVSQLKSSVDEEKLLKTFDNVVNKAYKIIENKGATYYGIATNLAKIAESILTDSNSIVAISAYLNGEYGLKNIYIGTPAVIGKDGINGVIELPLNDNEKENMKKSAEILKNLIEKIF